MAKATRIYTLTPAGLLDRSSRRITGHIGAPVQKVQSSGTPRNGVMGMCFIQHAETGEFIGQVCESSLTPTGQSRVPRDLAAEARENRAARRGARSRV
ncbi:MAG TPA: hypothetical protein VGL57_13385 [Solirubrobacteraceae bacterium]